MKRTLDEILYSIITKALIVLGLLMISFSVVIVLSSSFDSNIITDFPPQGFTTEWYENLFSKPRLMLGFRTSLILSPLTTITTALVGVAAAYGFSRIRRGREQVQAIFLSPLVVPGVVTGIALLYLLRGTFGFNITFINLFIGQVIVTLPYTFRTIVASMVGFDVSLEETARSLGAGRIRAFIHIVLPLVKPGVVAGAIFAFAMSFEDATVSVFLASSEASPIAVELMHYMRIMYDPTVAAASAFLTVGAIVMAIIIEKTVGLDSFVGIKEYQS